LIHASEEILLLTFVPRRRDRIEQATAFRIRRRDFAARRPRGEDRSLRTQDGLRS